MPLCSHWTDFDLVHSHSAFDENLLWDWDPPQEVSIFTTSFWIKFILTSNYLSDVYKMEISSSNWICVLCCVVWTMDIRPESCKRNRWFPCVGIFPNFISKENPLIRGGNMLKQPSKNWSFLAGWSWNWILNRMIIKARCSQFQIFKRRDENMNVIRLRLRLFVSKSSRNILR